MHQGHLKTHRERGIGGLLCHEKITLLSSRDSEDWGRGLVEHSGAGVGVAYPGPTLTVDYQPALARHIPPSRHISSFGIRVQTFMDRHSLLDKSTFRRHPRRCGRCSPQLTVLEHFTPSALTTTKGVRDKPSKFLPAPRLWRRDPGQFRQRRQCGRLRRRRRHLPNRDRLPIFGH